MLNRLPRIHFGLGRSLTVNDISKHIRAALSFLQMLWQQWKIKWKLNKNKSNKKQRTVSNSLLFFVLMFSCICLNILYFFVIHMTIVLCVVRNRVEFMHRTNDRFGSRLFQWVFFFFISISHMTHDT